VNCWNSLNREERCWAIGALLLMVFMIGLTVFAACGIAEEATETLQITATVIEQITISEDDMKTACEESGLMPSECWVDPNEIEKEIKK